jgi:hypothetical protein
MNANSVSRKACRKMTAVRPYGGGKLFVNRLHRVEETWMTYSSDQRVVGQNGGKQKDERREEDSADEELIDRVSC